MTRLERMLAAVARVGDDVLPQFFAPDSCIASTGVMLEVLAWLGVEAKPMPVEFALVNPRMRYALERGECSLLNPPPGSVMVGCSSSALADTEHHWSGHLVALVAQAFLLDMTLRQASRPCFDIYVTRPILAPLPMWPWTQPCIYTLAHGCGLMYNPTPRNRRYTSSGDWRKRHTLGRRVARIIVREVRAQLAAVEVEHEAHGWNYANLRRGQ